tara:strand:+ start:506 stop:919 length:414 start_codon:yes stop_codon:yes gene_type:complete
MDSLNLSNISNDGSVHLLNETITIPPIGTPDEIRNFLQNNNVGINHQQGVSLMDVYNYAYLRGFADGTVNNNSFDTDIGPPLLMEDLNTTLNNAVINVTPNNDKTDSEMDLSDIFGGKKRRRKTKKSLKKRRKTRRK